MIGGSEYFDNNDGYSWKLGNTHVELQVLTWWVLSFYGFNSLAPGRF